MFYALFFILGFTTAAGAQTKPPPAAANMSQLRGLSVSADESSRDTEADTLELHGHVQIIFKDEHMTCDTALINFRAKTIDASGNVLIVSPKATTGGSRIYFDYEADTGLIDTGYVKSGNVYFEGKTITRAGEDDYIADDAKFTTCTNCPESWSFSGQRIRAELGGYAYIKNSFLKVGGWPIFWLPYLVVPLKSNRQTGLLTPEFEQTTLGGLTLSESVFWAMSPSTDSTWTLKNYELRGLKSLANYRYVLSPTSSGELDVGSLRDRVFGGLQRVNDFRSVQDYGQPFDRWFIKYEHYYELPDGYVSRLHLNNASDLQYTQDFPQETRNLGDPSMENRMSITKNTKDQHFSLDSSYDVNLLKYNPADTNGDAVHRLPELRFSQTMTELGQSGVLATADVDYTNFARSGFGYDNMSTAYNPNTSSVTNPAFNPELNADPNDRSVLVSGDPSCQNAPGPPLSGLPEAYWYNNPKCYVVHQPYNPNTDLIRTGQRLDMQGALYRPFKIGESFDFMPKVSYRETQYQFAVGDNPTNIRRYARGEITGRTVFSALYGPDNSASLTDSRYKHEIVPEVSYTTIPYLDHQKHPFFGNQDDTPFNSEQNLSDADVNSPYGIQFDYFDRTYDRNLVTIGLTNKVIEKKFKDKVADYRQIVYWKIAQSYDIYQAESTIAHKEPFSDVLSDLRVSLGKLQLFQRINYYPYQVVTNSSSRLRVIDNSGDYVEGAYLRTYNISPGLPADPTTRTETYTLTIRKNFANVEFMGRATYDMNPPIPGPGDAPVHYKSYGYGAQVKLPGDCWYFTLTQYHPTGGDTAYNLSFDFIWDGSKKPTLPDNLLDTFGI